MRPTAKPCYELISRGSGAADRTGFTGLPHRYRGGCRDLYGRRVFIPGRR